MKEIEFHTDYRTAGTLNKLVSSLRLRLEVTRKLDSKGKAVTLQAWKGPCGSKRLRLPDFKTIGMNGGKFLSPTHQSPLPPLHISVRG
jgi:hypothetical protein